MAIDIGARDWAMYHQGEGDRPAGYHGEGGGSSSGGGGSSDELLRAQQAKQTDFLNRYTGAISGQESVSSIMSRLGEKYGLPALQESSNTAVNNFRNIEPDAQNQTRGFDVNEGQLRNIVSSRQQQQSPVVQNLLSATQNAQNLVGTEAGYAVADQAKALKPYEMEASLLNSQFGRELTGYSTDKQNELSTYLAKLQQGTQLSLTEMQQANTLAQMEQQHLNSLSLLQAQNSYKTTSSSTGSWGL